MSNPAITWSADSAQGFFLNITGNLTPDGKVWNGIITSPANFWNLSYPEVIIEPPSGSRSYHFDFGQINGNLIDGSLQFSSGGGYSSDAPAGTLPWSAGIVRGFSFNGAATTQGNWVGRTFMTFTWASNLADFSFWRYSIDVEILKN